MKPFIPLTFVLLLSLVACKQDIASQMQKVDGLDDEIAGSYPVVVTRNFPGPVGKGMVRMSADLRLGKNAFVAEASRSWLKILEKIAPGAPQNTLPVVFAKSFVFADGKTRLVVGQLECSFTGDGSWSPSSAFSCLLYTIDISNPNKLEIVWKGCSALGSLQHSRIIRMLPENNTVDEASVMHEVNLGDDKIERTVLTFKPSKGLTISMEKHATSQAIQ